MRTAVGLDDAQVSQQQGHRFGFHGRTAIRVDGELAGRDVLRVATMLDEPLGEFGAFAVGDHPTDDVATKNIQDDVEVVGGPLYRASQLGDVPTPQLGYVKACASNSQDRNRV